MAALCVLYVSLMNNSIALLRDFFMSENNASEVSVSV